MNLKSRENKVRKQLQKQGFKLQKSRTNKDIYHIGQYRILDLHNNTIVTGANYDLTIDDVEKFVTD